MKDTYDGNMKVIKDLVRELDKFNSYLKDSGKSGKRSRSRKRNYDYAFNPSAKVDKAGYKRDMTLIKAIYRVLDENHINVKCMGYAHLKDAVCIVSDMDSMDVCMMKELYPFIAEKNNLDSKIGSSRVEHSIRNAINAAYSLTRADYPDEDCLMNRFDSKPTNKAFILKLTQEVCQRLYEQEAAVD